MSGRVYCGRLSSTATEKDLEALLKTCGKVRHIDFKEGYAYAVFKDYHDADKAVNELNGKEFSGESILVERAKQARNGVGGYIVSGGVTSRSRQPKAPPLRTEHRLRVENLSTRAKWLELKEHMVSAGDVTFADAHRRRPGVGLVEYATREEMLLALKTLDDTEFYGKRISLVEEKAIGDKAQISRSRSRSRSRNRKRRSHSRSRSRSRGHKSHSRSPHKSRPRHRSRSKHRSNSRSHHNSKSSSHHRRRSHSNSRSRRHSNSLDKSKSRSRKNSHSPVKSHKKSRKSEGRSKSRSNSKSRSKSPKTH